MLNGVWRCGESRPAYTVKIYTFSISFFFFFFLVVLLLLSFRKIEIIFVAAYAFLVCRGAPERGGIGRTERHSAMMVFFDDLGPVMGGGSGVLFVCASV